MTVAAPTPTVDFDPGTTYASTADGTDVGTTLSVGGLTLTRSGTTPAVVQSAGGHKVLRGGSTSANATTAFTATSTAGNALTSVAMVVDVSASVGSLRSGARMVWGLYQGIDVQNRSGLQVMDYDGAMYPLTAGLHVIVLSGASGGDKVWVDGTLVYNHAITGTRTTTSRQLGWWGDLHRAQAWAGTALTDADAAAVWQDLGAQYGLIAAAATAAGSWAITGTGTLTVGAPDVPDAPAGTAGGSAVPPAVPEPQSPPAGVPDPVLWRVSETMPTPTLDSRGNPIGWAPTTVVKAPYARIQVVVEGVDITYWDGAPIPIPDWTRTEPFGSSTASIKVPQITPFHQLPGWCVSGGSVDIRLSRLDGSVASRFAGVLHTFGHSADTGEFTLEAAGVVFADDWQLRQPSFTTAPQDIGSVIADALNATISRRHDAIAPVVTGCLTSVAGGWEPKVTGYVQQLLATAVTGGRQWTVACAERSPALVLKDTTTVGWTTHNGQRGVQIDLNQDWSQAPNVIYGEGIGPDGGRWRNAMYPNWRPDDTPVFPMAPTQSFKVGTTDANTSTGTGVSDWQAKVGLPVTGRYTLTDRARCIQVQTAAGIQRDGFVGPQTWAASFGTGSNTGTLDCFYMPIAYAPNVMPRLYGPTGADLGPNPAYDPDVLRVEQKIDFGQGVGKGEGIRAGGEILTQNINPGWAGTVTFTTDPQECSKYDILEGSNGKLRGFRGTDLLVHVARVDYTEDTVTATVDTNARDYPTLAAIRDRERNATDPAKAKVRRLNQGNVTQAIGTFDAESPAGQVPRHALFANLWTVIRIPFGVYGSIIRSELTTTGAASEFAVAVFDSAITAADLLSLVGNPLTASSNPWTDQADALADRGLLMAWGWANQPAGYYPGEYSNPDGDAQYPVTGRMLDDASWDYSSTQPPWLWVAEIASSGCYIEGRFWPGAE